MTDSRPRDLRGLDDRDLDVVNRRQRVEEAFPLLPALAADPELTGRRTEVECRRLQVVDRHRIAQDREVALLLRHPLRQPVPGIAAILAAPDGGSAVGTRP